MLPFYPQATDAVAIRELISKKDAKKALDSIKANPKCLVWKDPNWYNDTLLHHAAKEDAGGFIDSIFEVNTTFTYKFI